MSSPSQLEESPRSEVSNSLQFYEKAISRMNNNLGYVLRIIAQKSEHEMEINKELDSFVKSYERFENIMESTPRKSRACNVDLTLNNVREIIQKKLEEGSKGRLTLVFEELEQFSLQLPGTKEEQVRRKTVCKDYIASLEEHEYLDLLEQVSMARAHKAARLGRERAPYNDDESQVLELRKFEIRPREVQQEERGWQRSGQLYKQGLFQQGAVQGADKQVMQIQSRGGWQSGQYDFSYKSLPYQQNDGGESHLYCAGKLLELREYLASELSDQPKFEEVIGAALVKLRQCRCKEQVDIFQQFQSIMVSSYQVKASLLTVINLLVASNRKYNKHEALAKEIKVLKVTFKNKLACLHKLFDSWAEARRQGQQIQLRQQAAAVQCNEESHSKQVEKARANIVSMEKELKRQLVKVQTK